MEGALEVLHTPHARPETLDIMNNLFHSSDEQNEIYDYSSKCDECLIECNGVCINEPEPEEFFEL